MNDHVFSIGDIIKVKNGAELPFGYNVTCEEWVGVVRALGVSGRIGVATLITKDGNWRKDNEYTVPFVVEEKFFEIA